MIPEILNSYARTLGYLGQLMADVPDADTAVQLPGAPRPPARA